MTEQEIIDCLKGNREKGVAFAFMPQEVKDWCEEHKNDAVFCVYLKNGWYEEGVTLCQCFGKYDARNDEPLEECENCMAFESYDDWKAIEKRIKEIKEGAR